MNEELQNQIENIIDEKLMSFTNMTVPPHRHNAVDSPRIASSDLYPYVTDTTVFTVPPENPNGTIRYYNFTENTTPSYNFGEFIYLNNQLNRLSISDFYLSAATASQTINDGNNDTIIFQNSFQVSPSGAYSTTTGVFSAVNNSNGTPMVYDDWFLVTATVLLDSGVAGGTFTISIVADGSLSPQSSVVYPGIADSFTLQISQALYLSGISTLEIKVANNSGSSRDVIGFFETRLSIKQLK